MAHLSGVIDLDHKAALADLRLFRRELKDTTKDVTSVRVALADDGAAKGISKLRADLRELIKFGQNAKVDIAAHADVKQAVDGLGLVKTELGAIGKNPRVTIHVDDKAAKTSARELSEERRAAIAQKKAEQAAIKAARDAERQAAREAAAALRAQKELGASMAREIESGWRRNGTVLNRYGEEVGTVTGLLKKMTAEEKAAQNAASAANAARKTKISEGKSAGRELGDRVSRGGDIAGAAALGGIAASVKLYEEYDRSLRNVNSIAQLSEPNLQKLSASIRAISADRNIKKGPEDLAAGLYDIYSVGFKGQKALDALRDSARGASAGATTTAVAVDALTGTLNAGIKGATTSRQVMDGLFQTVNDGKVSFPQLAGAIGQTLPFLKSGGVSLQEYGAYMADATAKSQKAEFATNNLNNLISKLAAPPAEAAKQFDKLGIKYGFAELKAKGLSGKMAEIAAKTKGSDDALKALFPDMQAFTAAQTITTNKMAGYNAMLERQKTATQGVGATQRALAKQNQGLSNDVDQAKKNLQLFGLTVAQTVAPVVSDLTQKGTALLEKFQSLSPETQSATVKTVLFGGAALLVAGRVKSLFELVGLGGKMFGGLKAAMGGAKLASDGTAASLVKSEEAAKLLENPLDHLKGKLEDVAESKVDELIESPKESLSTWRSGLAGLKARLLGTQAAAVETTAALEGTAAAESAAGASGAAGAAGVGAFGVAFVAVTAVAVVATAAIGLYAINQQKVVENSERVKAANDGLAASNRQVGLSFDVLTKAASADRGAAKAVADLATQYKKLEGTGLEKFRDQAIPAARRAIQLNAKLSLPQKAELQRDIDQLARQVNAQLAAKKFKQQVTIEANQGAIENTKKAFFQTYGELYSGWKALYITPYLNLATVAWSKTKSGAAGAYNFVSTGWLRVTGGMESPLNRSLDSMKSRFLGWSSSVVASLKDRFTGFFRWYQGKTANFGETDGPGLPAAPPTVHGAPKSAVWLAAHPGYNDRGERIDGSHALGLNRVPFDGYRAELHKDEAVLTSDEAKSWRREKSERAAPNGGADRATARSLFERYNIASTVDMTCADVAGNTVRALGFHLKRSINAAQLEKNAIAAGWVPVSALRAPAGSLVFKASPSARSKVHAMMSLGNGDLASSSNHRTSYFRARGSERAYAPPGGWGRRGFGGNFGADFLPEFGDEDGNGAPRREATPGEFGTAFGRFGAAQANAAALAMKRNLIAQIQSVRAARNELEKLSAVRRDDLALVKAERAYFVARPGDSEGWDKERERIEFGRGIEKNESIKMLRRRGRGVEADVAATRMAVEYDDVQRAREGVAKLRREQKAADDLKIVIKERTEEARASYEQSEAEFGNRSVEIFKTLKTALNDTSGTADDLRAALGAVPDDMIARFPSLLDVINRVKAAVSSRREKGLEFLYGRGDALENEKGEASERLRDYNERGLSESQKLSRRGGEDIAALQKRIAALSPELQVKAGAELERAKLNWAAIVGYAEQFEQANKTDEIAAFKRERVERGVDQFVGAFDTMWGEVTAREKSVLDSMGGLLQGALDDWGRQVLQSQLKSALTNLFLGALGGGTGGTTGGGAPARVATASDVGPRRIDGSFAVGIDRVPRDMIARIHQDEAVLPRDHAEDYRRRKSAQLAASAPSPSGGAAGGTVIVVNVQHTGDIRADSPDDYHAQMMERAGRAAPSRSRAETLRSLSIAAGQGRRYT